MERFAAWYDGLPPAEKAAYDKQHAEHRRALDLDPEENTDEPT